MTKHLKTVDQVIALLGGNIAVIRIVAPSGDAAPNLVAMWKIRGKFPPRTFIAIQKALQARGATAPDKLWGMS